MPKPPGEPNKALAAAIREMVGRAGMQQGITLPGSPFPADFPYETPEELGPFPEMGLGGPEVTPPGMGLETGQQRFPGPMDIRPGRGMPGPMVSPPTRARPTPPISAGRGTVVTGGPPSFPPSPMAGPPGPPPGAPPGMPPGPPPRGAPPGVAPPPSPQIGPGRITAREPAGPEIGQPTITGREPQPPPTAPPATQPPPMEITQPGAEREFGAAGSPEQIINKFVQSGVAEYDESGGQKILRVPGGGTPGKMIQMGEYQVEEMLLQDPFFRGILEKMTGEKAPLPQEHKFPQGPTIGGEGSLEFME